MEKIGLADVNTFVEMYRQASFEQRFNRLTKGFKEVQGESRLAAPGFNVFQLMKIGRREVKTHSAFLADLLDPAGSHGQGFDFLKAFFIHCKHKKTVPIKIKDCQFDSMLFPEVPGAIEEYRWEITKEKGTPRHGRMDIVIHCPTLKLLCVIENKIGADERKRQLKDYWDWMQTQKKIAHKALFFLTPEGRDSRTAGCTPYFKLSYNEDIYEWLTDAEANIDAAPVAAVVEQYSQLALRLRGRK